MIFFIFYFFHTSWSYADVTSVSFAMIFMCNYLQEYPMSFTGLLGLVL